MPYQDLLIKNGLVEIVEGDLLRYRITSRGEEVLGHMRAQEELMPEMAVEEGLT